MVLSAVATSDRRERKRERMASHLSETAFKLFESEGYDAVSMEQIAAEADVAKATLYSYFPVKEALIAHHFREEMAAGMNEHAAALAAHRTFDARMRYLLRESAAWHTARKAYLPPYLLFLTSQACYGDGSPGYKGYDSGSLQILTLMFEAGQQSGEVTAEQSAVQIAWSFQYMLFGEVSAWLHDPGSSLTERFLTTFDLLMHGAARAPSKVTQKQASRAHFSRGKTK